MAAYLGTAERIHAHACVDAGVVVLGLKGPAGVRRLKVGDKVVYYSPRSPMATFSVPSPPSAR